MPTHYPLLLISFSFFYPLYLNTLTISLSPPTSWLHLFNIPVSTKPHFSMTLPDAGLPVKWSAQMFSKCFSLMPAILHEVPHQGLRRTWRVPLHPIPANGGVKFFLFSSDYINENFRSLLCYWFMCKYAISVGTDHWARGAYHVFTSSSGHTSFCKDTNYIQKWLHTVCFCWVSRHDLTLFIRYEVIKTFLIVKLCKIPAHFLRKCAEIEIFWKFLHWDYRIIEI